MRVPQRRKVNHIDAYTYPPHNRVATAYDKAVEVSVVKRPRKKQPHNRRERKVRVALRTTVYAPRVP